VSADDVESAGECNAPEVTDLIRAERRIADLEAELQRSRNEGEVTTDVSVGSDWRTGRRVSRAAQARDAGGRDAQGRDSERAIREAVACLEDYIGAMRVEVRALREALESPRDRRIVELQAEVKRLEDANAELRFEASSLRAELTHLRSEIEADIREGAEAMWKDEEA
jgi:chromosome segregation ATPase